MKTITTNGIITGVRRIADRSLSLTVHTPELDPLEAAYFMEYQNINSKLTIEPLDTVSESEYEIKTEVNEKTPSQRMRAVLFLLWKQGNEQGQFQDFYNQKMENLIEKLKEKIN